MGVVDDQQDGQDGAVTHLEAALETDDPEEKDFHVKHALQLLGVAGEE